MTKKLCLVLLVLLFSFTSIVVSSDRLASAQSLTGIRADISSLRTRINRLEGEVRRLSRPTQNNVAPQPTNPPLRTPYGVVDGQAVGTTDPMFARLATLVIELKEDIQDLQNRVAELEQQDS